MRRRRAAFTLVELLVVMAIIAVLAALLLAGVGRLKDSAKSSRTSTILAAAMQGVHLWGADRGGLPSPVEHPLAGSAAPRALWRRSDHSDTTTAGVAVYGLAVGNLSAANRGRLILPDDRYSDTAAPALFGVAREALGVLGVGMAAVTRFVVLPDPGDPGVTVDPDAPGAGRLIAPNEAPAASEPFLRTVLGKGGVFDDLARTGALRSPPDDATLAYHGRIWSATKAGKEIDGTMTVTDADGQHRYLLRGAAIYDAWGNEVLYAIEGAGRNARFTSAGRDGRFRFAPGGDGIFQTGAEDAAPAGDDRDASIDNVSTGRR